MDDIFKIYIRRLTEGRNEKIQEKLDPSFMDVVEPELSFRVLILIKGEAGLAQNTLVLRLRIETEATMVCAICNRDIQIKIFITDFCHTEETSLIKGGVFDYSSVLREAILLELPLNAECEGGCPEREALSGFFSKKKNEDDKFHPFEDL